MFLARLTNEYNEQKANAHGRAAAVSAADAQPTTQPDAPQKPIHNGAAPAAQSLESLLPRTLNNA